MNKIKALGVPKIKALGLNNLRGVENPPQKSLKIRYLSCEDKAFFLILKFEVEARGLNHREIKAFFNVFREDSGRWKQYSNESITSSANINPNGRTRIEIQTPLGSNINFNNYFEQNVYYQATVNVDGLSATSERFNLKLKKEQNLFFSVSDVKKIVKELRENTFFTDKGKKYPLTQLPYYSIDKIFHRNDKSGKYSSEVVTNNSFENFTTQLNKIFDKYEINNPRRIRHFLSQIFIETQYFSQTIETDNSYTHNYDPLRGRGFIHLTTKGNYKKYTKYKQEVDKLNIDFEINYSLLSTNLEYSADCSGWYWKFGREKDLNVLADTYSVEKLTPWINAASLNLEERKNAYQLLEKIIV